VEPTHGFVINTYYINNTFTSISGRPWVCWGVY